MTDNEIRIAIAEACGWKDCRETLPGEFYGVQTYGKTRVHKWEAELPDYPNDLNAMHEAEKMLNAERQLDYARRLHELFSGARHCLHSDFDVAHASAHQRAEAFLLTVKECAAGRRPATLAPVKAKHPDLKITFDDPGEEWKE